jgi:plastocyanin
VQQTRRIVGSLVVAAGVLGLPATAAHAATVGVGAGPPAAIQKKLPPVSTDNAFYPGKVTVHVGDKVKFAINGFHDVYFAKKGTTPPGLGAPDPANPVAGQVDAAGQPFFFNGQPNITAPITLLTGQGDGKIDGKAVDASPIAEGKPKPYIVTFKKKGTFSYVCVIHPGMAGTVKVVGKRAKASTKKAIAAAVKKQGKTAIAQAKKLAAVVPSGNTILAGSDNSHIVNLAFFPATKTVPVGTTVNFDMPKRSTEIHTVSFGPQDVLENLTSTFITPGPTGITFNPLVVYPSDPGPLSYTAANHGNGFLNSGILDTEAASPSPSSTSITFTKPGTYKYICIVHGPIMAATITVQ